MTDEHQVSQYFNPRPPRGGRLCDIITIYRYLVISIHAPREGGDHQQPYHHQCVRISIHAPREGGDVGVQMKSFNTKISIHAPREGGDAVSPACLINYDKISIHAPREGGDRET